MGKPMKVLFLLEYNQIETDEIDVLVNIVKKLKASLYVDLFLSTQSSMIMPGIPIGPIAIMDKKMNKELYKESENIIKLIKNKCAKIDIACDGEIFIDPIKRYNTNPRNDYDLIITRDKIKKSILLNGLLKNKYDKLLQNSKTPVWIMKSLSENFKSSYYFELRIQDISMCIDLINKCTVAFKLFDLKIISEQLEMNRILKNEIAKPGSIINIPSLLVFHSSCFMGNPFFNKTYRYVKKLIHCSPHHIMILP